MTFGDRLQKLRVDLGLSQGAVGAQGFVSAPGWIKIENGQRQASEKLIDNLLKWLVADKHIPAKNAAPLREELLTLKYLGSSSKFVRDLAGERACSTLEDEKLFRDFEASLTNRPKRRRGRPPGPKKGGKR